MLFLASILLLGCSFAFADTMGCCEVKRVPGDMPMSGNYYLDTEYHNAVPDFCRDGCVYSKEMGSERYCFKPSSTYTAECQEAESSWNPSDFSASCTQLEQIHNATAHVRLAYHCSDSIAVGGESDCDRNILQNLMDCRAEDQDCAFNVIAFNSSCLPENEPNAICKTLHRSNNFLINARKASCSMETDASSSSSGCSWLKAAECTAKIVAALAGCVHSPSKLQCIKNVLIKEGAGDCLVCICKIAHVCSSTESGSGAELTFNENGQTLGTDLLYATCDNVMTVYFDGFLQPETDAMKDWRNTSQLRIPANTSVLAIQCKNLGEEEGILASTSTGLISDNSWQCYKDLIDGWTLPDFVPPPNTFADANTAGLNGVAPWGQRPGISGEAEWIWPRGTSSNEAYCRKML